MTGTPRRRGSGAHRADRGSDHGKTIPTSIRRGSAGALLSLAIVTSAAASPSTGTTAAQSPSVVSAPTTATPVLSGPSRGLRAQAARLSAEGSRFAASRLEESLALARAAVQAARGAAAVSAAAGDTDVQVDLETAADALLAMRAAARSGYDPPRGGLRADTPTTARGPDAPGIAQAVAARELEAGAQQLFLRVFEVEAPTRTAVAEISSVPLAELAVVDTALAVAEGATGATDLSPLVPLTLGGSFGLDGPGGQYSGLALPYPNGAIPLDALCSPEAAPAEHLRCDAAVAFDLLAARYLADTGEPLRIVSSYRTYERQVEVKRLRGFLAATPGTSQHGLGIAIDLADAGDVGEFDSPIYLWMKEHAEDFGWTHLAAMEPGGRGPQEPWHWEFRGW